MGAAWRLEPGETAVIGSQVVWLGTVGREAFREEAQRFYAAIGLEAAEAPDWLAEAILYETNAAGHIDSRFSDVGGFDRLARQAPYLAELGVNAIWLQGVHGHKTSPDPMKGGWNLYDPRDYDTIDPILGGAEGLTRLMAALGAHGFHVLGELVPHGGHSVQAEALEDWWTCGRDGKALRAWGGCGMDYSSPEWQAVMARAAAQLATDFGMEGVRIDVAEGSGPNWKSPRTNQASYSTLAGSLEMLRAIRDGAAQGVETPLLIPENWNNPDHFAVSPVGYGHSLWMLIARTLSKKIDDPAGMAADLRDFLERERGSYPRGARILRYLGNHDTVCEAGRAQQLYGAGLARALYGVCLMAQGVPMMYQEDEVGNYEALRRLNWARRNVPEFATATPTTCPSLRARGVRLSAHHRRRLRPRPVQSVRPDDHRRGVLSGTL